MKDSSSNSQDHPIETETYKRLENLANLLDNAFNIPGTSYNIGIDPILGIFPLVGDYLGLFLSSYILWESAKLGASKYTISSMAVNLIIDMLIGVFPFFGDIFDVAWKANDKNIVLLKNHLQSPQKQKKVDKLFLFLLLSILFIFITIITTITFMILKFIFSSLNL